MAKGDTPKHTACHPGKRVCITLRDGKKIFDIFKERKKGDIYLKDYGLVKKRDMKSFRVVKKT